MLLPFVSAVLITFATVMEVMGRAAAAEVSLWEKERERKKDERDTKGCGNFMLLVLLREEK